MNDKIFQVILKYTQKFIHIIKTNLWGGWKVHEDTKEGMIRYNTIIQNIANLI